MMQGSRWDPEWEGAASWLKGRVGGWTTTAQQQSPGSHLRVPAGRPFPSVGTEQEDCAQALGRRFVCRGICLSVMHSPALEGCMVAGRDGGGRSRAAICGAWAHLGVQEAGAACSRCSPGPCCCPSLEGLSMRPMCPSGHLRPGSGLSKVVRAGCIYSLRWHGPQAGTDNRG